MYIKIDDKKYPCGNVREESGGIVFTGVVGMEKPPTGVITLYRDDGFEMRADDAGAYKRVLLDGGVLTLTNEPEPMPPTEGELLAAARAAAIERISGKCSAAIYAGVDVGGKHCTLSKNEQDALAIAQTKVDKGATAVIYGDGLTDAATITAVSQAAYEWGVVCTTYYAYLKQYIAAETDVSKLAAIDFGKALPDSYMQQLTALLNSAGIDISKYAAMFT